MVCIGEYCSLSENPQLGMFCVDLGFMRQEYLKTASAEHVRHDLSDAPHFTLDKIWLTLDTRLTIAGLLGSVTLEHGAE